MEQKLQQLHHEVSHKDELLKWVDKEIADRDDNDKYDMKQSLLNLNQECQQLKDENSRLKNQHHGIKVETAKVEAKETALIQHCLNQLGETVSQISKLEIAAEQKSEEIVLLKRDLEQVTSNLTELTKRHVQLIDDNNELRLQVNTMREEQKMAQQQLAMLQKKYEECLVMLEDGRKHMTKLNSTSTPHPASNFGSYETPSQPTPSIMNELEDAIISDLQLRRMRPSVPKNRFTRTRARLTRSTRAMNETTDDSDNKDSGVKSETDSESSNERVYSSLDKSYSLDTPVNNKRRLRRGTASTVSDAEVGTYAKRDALQELIADSEPEPNTKPSYSHYGSTQSVNSDTNITSVSDSWRSEPIPGTPGHRNMYGTNKLKMVKPLEGSMTLLQWKLLAMKQNNSLLTSEERPGVLQRNTVTSTAHGDGFGGLGSLGDLSSTNSGIFSKGALTPVASRNITSRDAIPRAPRDPHDPSLPNNKPQKPGDASSSKEGERQPDDIFAYLSTKYNVPKTGSDFSSTTSETRPGSKVKVSTQSRSLSSQYVSEDRSPDSKPPAGSSGISKSASNSSSSGFGRLFGWS